MQHKKVITTKSSQETERLAEQIGAKLKGREVIELASDLGGGKTTFARGLARGASSDSHVSSPTFTISNVYDAPKFEIHHFDFYRLPEPGLIAHELHDVLQDNDAVVVIEWGNMLSQVLPQEILAVNIKRTGEESREITVEYPDSLAYLMEEKK